MASLGTIRIKWNGAHATTALRAAASRGIRAVVAHAERLCQEAVSVSGNTGAGAVSWPGQPPRKYTHSLPGQPPRSITGKGRQSIFGKMTGPTKGIVGTNLAYMAFLELGVAGGKAITPTRKMALCFAGVDPLTGVWSWLARKKIIQGRIQPRPWLVKTITDNIGELQEVFQREAQAAFEQGARVKGAGAS